MRARGVAVLIVLAAACSERSGKRSERASSRLVPARELPAAVSPNAYGHALDNLPRERWADVRAGKALFTTRWVPPGELAAARAELGASALLREGLGPRHSAVSCEGCHFKDGRGRPPPNDPLAVRAPDEPPPRLLRWSAPGVGGELMPEPTYGAQLQELAVAGLAPEGRLALAMHQVQGRYLDGEAYQLERPVVQVRGLERGPLHPEARLALRHPASLIGLGLLEAVATEDVLALADPEDEDGDGISGRASWVRDPDTGERVLGRFGWKASQPTLWAQNALALREDLGVTSPAHPGATCSPTDAACARLESEPAPELAPAPELDRQGLEQLTAYTRLLMPPRSRWAGDAIATRGAALFSELGCASCHRRELRTAEHGVAPELAGRSFEPYTDLLLHDLGEDLADPGGGEQAREWRTAPLWGLGLLEVVSGQVRLLHDGRARSAEEAILWHGGEATASRAAFLAAARNERAALLAFLAAL